MKKLLILSGMFVYTFSNAQSVTPIVMSNDGGFFDSPQGSVAWTVGEPISETYSQGVNITTMGFHQAEIVEIKTLISKYGKDQSILVFPNPVKDDVNISFKGIDDGTYALELVDALGKLLYQSNANISGTADNVKINVTNYAAGTYFLKINGKDFNKTVKINKQY